MPRINMKKPRKATAKKLLAALVRQAQCYRLRGNIDTAMRLEDHVEVFLDSHPELVDYWVDIHHSVPKCGRK